MEGFYNKNSDEEKMSAKRRSSILKTPRNRDPFSEIEPPVEITLSKSVRRVSFASSNFVKPFVADPDKNTIWDTTYEEEVDHTNSTQSSQEQMSTKLNSTFLHNNVTNFETSDMDITKLIRDKENILQTPPVISIVDYAKQRSSNVVVPLYDITTQNSIIMNATQTHTPAMEFTCQYFTPYLQETEPADAPSEMELTEICLSEESEQSVVSKTKHPLHCGAENVVLSKTDNIHATSLSKTRRDMELYQNPDFDKTLLGNGHISKRDLCQISSKQDFNKDQITCMPEPHSKEDMEFTCQIPADTVLGTDKSMNDMELTCQIPEKLSKSRQQSKTEKSLSSDMEFTCQIPAGAVLEADRSTNDMGLAHQIPEKLSKSRQLAKTEKRLSSEMEFTCQIPAGAVLETDKSMNDMELTCQIPEKLSKSRQLSKTEKRLSSDMEFTCQIPADPVLEADKSMNDMGLAHQKPEKLSKIENTLSSDMGFTCQIPAGAVLQTDKSMNDTELTRHIPDMQITCQIPADTVLEVDESMNDMKLARQIPEELSKSKKLSKTEKTSTSDVENACQISKTVTVNNIELPKMSSTNDMNMTLASQAPFTRMPTSCQIKDTNKLSTVENMGITGEVHSLSKTNTKTGCQIPQEYSLTNVENSEISCQIPKLQNSCHDMNETEYMEVSYGDLQVSETKSIELGCQISQEQGLSKTENMKINQTEMSVENITHEIDKTKTIDKITNSSKIPTRLSPLDSKNTLELLDRKLVNQSDSDKVEGTPKVERTFVKKQISQTTPKNSFNTSKIPVRSPSWMKIDTPSKKNRYRSENKEESQLPCADKNDIVFSQKMPNLSSDKNSFYLYKTPEPSFLMNSSNITSGVDDTQLLLHCTYNKTYPNSLFSTKMENEVSCYNSFSLKETENITKPNISNMNISDADCVASNDSRSSSDTSFIDIQSNKLATVNDTYVLKGKKHVTLKDETLNFDEYIEPNNETLNDELSSIPVNCFEVKLQKFNVEIGNKFDSNNLVKRIEEQRIKQIDFMKRFKFKPIHIPKLAEKRSEGELPSQKNKGNENEPSIEDKVKEHQKRCQDSWKLEQINGDFYHFSTLSNAVVFTAQIDPSNGKVQSLESTNKLTDKAHPLHRYAVKQFLHKLEDNHVKAAIGKQHDLLSLLDYVQMVRMQITSLLGDLIKCDLTIERDCIASFWFFNDTLGLHFVVSVDVTDLENINYDSVEITQKIGTVNESELKNYLKNVPKGWSFFKEFFQAIKDFLTVKEKRRRF